MDINGTKFHLLTGPGDWLPHVKGHDENTLWWDNDTATVSLLPKIVQYSSSTDARALTANDRRGAAVDFHNNIYWIADGDVKNEQSDLRATIAGKAIRYLPHCERRAEEFWSLSNLQDTCVRNNNSVSNNDSNSNAYSDFTPVPVEQDPVFKKLQGLAITTENYMIVGTLEPGGLIVFDLHAGGVPSVLIWPRALNFRPFDLAPAVDGGVWILDRDEFSGVSRCWRLDRHLRVLPINPELALSDLQAINLENDFTDCALPTNSAVLITEVSAEYCLPLVETDPVSIIGLEDNSFLLLSSVGSPPVSVISRYLNHERISTIELKGGIIDDVFEGLRVKAHDFAFISAQPSVQYQIVGELMLVLESGDQALAFNVSIRSDSMRLQLRPLYFPLRQFGGRALVTGTDHIYYDLGERWYPLVSQPRRRYVDKATVLLRFDGKESSCVWHRIVMDACIPDGTEIEIKSRCANEETNLEYIDWHLEALPFKRATGKEIPFYATDNEDQLELAAWEWVFHKAEGRYVELAITLKGNVRRSPRIQALRVYYPRFSYVQRFLPEIYQEQDREDHFLNRYLANAEGIFTHIESMIARAQIIFDTRVTPDNYLDWLASWLGGVMDESWDSSRKRLFIDHAVLLYRWRGTKIGLRAAIRLAVDTCVDTSLFSELLNEEYDNPFGAGGDVVRIEEHFRKRTPSGVVSQIDQQTSLYSRTATSELSELGDAEAVSQRYREFLYRKYKQEAADTVQTLALLSEAWSIEPAYQKFEEIVFTATRPLQVNELADWTWFLRRELSMIGEWNTAQGVFALHIRYQEWLRKKYSVGQNETLGLEALNNRWGQNYAQFEDIQFSPVKPQEQGKAVDWFDFIKEGLGFTYSPITKQEAGLYREFLARRYQQVDELNLAYGLTLTQSYTSFAAVDLPEEDTMPEHPTAFRNWIQFASLTLPIKDNAHQFSVLVPTKLGELPQVRQKRIAQVQKIVEIEKPAHTDFDVKLFWALFQVGSARLGVDTIVGEGARYSGIVLGDGYIGQNYLQSSHPWNLLNRPVAGRDRLQHAQKGEY